MKKIYEYITSKDNDRLLITPKHLQELSIKEGFSIQLATCEKILEWCYDTERLSLEKNTGHFHRPQILFCWLFNQPSPTLNPPRPLLCFPLLLHYLLQSVMQTESLHLQSGFFHVTWPLGVRPWCCVALLGPPSPPCALRTDRSLSTHPLAS